MQDADQFEWRICFSAEDQNCRNPLVKEHESFQLL